MKLPEEDQQSFLEELFEDSLGSYVKLTGERCEASWRSSTKRLGEELGSFLGEALRSFL